jgi:gamma-glutamyltranspeptidase
VHEPLVAVEVRALKALGHTLEPAKGPIGDAQVVGVENGALVGIPDPRGRGSN